MSERKEGKQASNGETKELGGTIGRGRLSWEKPVTGDLATRQLMVAAANEKSRTWRHVIHWLSPGLLPACRSVDNEPNGGVASQNGAVARKVHQRVFPAL